MKSIKVHGKGKPPILPSYTVTINVLDPLDIIAKGDYICVGDDIHSVHSWSKIHPETIMIGNTAGTYKGAKFGRKEE
jgi:hypothetical protein